MLHAIGIDQLADLFKVVPAKHRFPDLALPPAETEMEAVAELQNLAWANESARDLVCFLGAGAYNHYVPAAVDAVLRRGEFLTAYTPYQPELSQGTLQAIFEYQSLVAALTGMDVSNASHYDGATAVAEAGADAPKFTEEDMVAIGSPVDFVGTNIYMAHHIVRASQTGRGFEVVPYQPTHPNSPYPGVDLAIQFTPESMYWGTRLLVDLWNVKEIYITENGGPFPHEPGLPGLQPDIEGMENDSDRIVWTRAYLSQLQRATADGVPVRGYFHWSLLDNFEWQDGWWPQFGLVEVDRKHGMKRTVRPSAKWFAETIKKINE